MSANCEKCDADLYMDEDGFYCPICRSAEKIEELEKELEEVKGQLETSEKWHNEVVEAYKKKLAKYEKVPHEE